MSDLHHLLLQQGAEAGGQHVGGPVQQLAAPHAVHDVHVAHEGDTGSVIINIVVTNLML